MAIVLMIACVILSMFLHAAMRDAGVAPRTRGSMRYQRRKANKLGVGFHQVDVRPRNQANYVPGEPDGESHVADLKWGFGMALLTIIGLIVGASVMGVMGLHNWWAVLPLVAIGLNLWLNRRRKRKNRMERELPAEEPVTRRRLRMNGEIR